MSDSRIGFVSFVSVGAGRSWRLARHPYRRIGRLRRRPSSILERNGRQTSRFLAANQRWCRDSPALGTVPRRRAHQLSPLLQRVGIEGDREKRPIPAEVTTPQFAFARAAGVPIVATHTATDIGGSAGRYLSAVPHSAFANARALWTGNLLLTNCLRTLPSQLSPEQTDQFGNGCHRIQPHR